MHNLCNQKVATELPLEWIRTQGYSVKQPNQTKPNQTKPNQTKPNQTEDATDDL